MTWTAANGDVGQSLADKKILSLGTHDSVLFAGMFLQGLFYSYSRYGTFRSTDLGATWSEPCTRAVSGALIVSGRDLYCSEGDRILQLNKQGGGWHSIWETSYPTICSGPFYGSDSGANGLHMAITLTDANIDTLNQLLLSTNGGATWEKIRYPPTVRENPLYPDFANFLGEKDSILFFHVYSRFGLAEMTDSVGGLFFTSDRGKTWGRASNRSLNEHLGNFYIADLEAIPDPSAAGGKSMFIGSWNGVFRSTDDGVSWTQDTIGIDKRGVHRPVRSGNDMYLLVGGMVSTFYDEYGNVHTIPSGNGVYRWNPTSSTWTQLGNDVPLLIGSTLSVGKRGTGTQSPAFMVYGYDTTGNTQVACASVDGGVHWSYLPSDYSTKVESAVLMEDTVYEWFAIPSSQQVRKACLADVIITSVSERQRGLAGGCVLNQNFPNPFNPTTTISYEIPKAAQVKLIVYDILGREVQTLVNETKQPGRYEAVFNATNYASGIYICRMQAGSFVQSRKICLIR